MARMVGTVEEIKSRCLARREGSLRLTCSFQGSAALFSLLFTIVMCPNQRRGGGGGGVSTQGKTNARHQETGCGIFGEKNSVNQLRL